MIGRDSLIGASAALDDGPALTDAIVVVPGTASMLKAEDLRSATERNSSLRKLLARNEQALFVQAQQSAACNASHSVESRLRLRAQDLCDSEGLPLTQEFLAQMIGVRRMRFRSWLTRFSRPSSSAISRGHIEIRDIEGLRKTFCECYAAVRMQCDRLLNATGEQVIRPWSSRPGKRRRTQGRRSRASICQFFLPTIPVRIILPF